MARGQHQSTAFKSNFPELTLALSKLQERVQAASIVPPTFDIGHVMRVVVPPEHRQLASDAHEVLKIQGSYSHSKKLMVKGYPCIVNFSFNSYNKFPFCYPEQQKHMYDEHLEAELLAWGQKQGEFYWEWYLHGKALEALNNYCSKPEQVRFYTPAIITLLEMSEQYKTADKVREFKVPRTLPPIPAALRDHLPKLTNAVARALLTPPKPEEPKTGIKVWLNATALMNGIKVPWPEYPPLSDFTYERI
jgi:hypothetical protein